jgi:hypothetical protein
MKANKVIPLINILIFIIEMLLILATKFQYDDGDSSKELVLLLFFVKSAPLLCFSFATLFMTEFMDSKKNLRSIVLIVNIAILIYNIPTLLIHLKAFFLPVVKI